MYERLFFTTSMTNTAERQIEALMLLGVPRGLAVDWDPTSAKVGLQQLRRFRGEIAPLEAVLVGPRTEPVAR